MAQLRADASERMDDLQMRVNQDESQHKASRLELDAPMHAECVPPPPQSTTRQRKAHTPGASCPVQLQCGCGMHGAQLARRCPSARPAPAFVLCKA